MNPSTLHFSKVGNLVVLALMVGVGALAIWLLLESSMFAGPQPLPPPGTEFRLGEAPPDSPDILLFEPAPERERPGDSFRAIIVIACLPLALWEIGIKSWRLLTPKPALALQNGQLVPHASYVTAPASISIEAIRNVIFDRTDRVRLDGTVAAMTAFSWSSRLGMKAGGRLRHTLLIDFVTDGGERQSFRIGDSDVDGGVEQMKRFVDYLGMMRRGR